MASRWIAMPALGIAGVLLTASAPSANAQYRSGPTGMFQRAPVGLFYRGVQGYSRSGWEIGRMISQRQYRVDPGPWPGLGPALGYPRSRW